MGIEKAVGWTISDYTDIKRTDFVCMCLDVCAKHCHTLDGIAEKQTGHIISSIYACDFCGFFFFCFCFFFLRFLFFLPV
jgi:hypothetical protein